MTLPMIKQSTCANCGHQQESYSLLSSNTDGFEDLDLRPAEMLRSSMHYWVQECQKCGFCFSDLDVELSEEGKGILNFVLHDSYYQEIKNDKRLSELATRFYRQALILAAFDEHEKAGWAYMHAAWACDDDAPAHAGANMCRMDAYRCFCKCKILGIPFAPQNGFEEVIMIDALRRASEFEKANTLCFNVIGYLDDTEVIRILEFQRNLIWSRNCGCYNMGHVFPEKESNGSIIL